MNEFKDGIIICNAYLDQERFERIGNLVPHVGIREVETRQNDGLELLLGPEVLVDEVADEHGDEYHVGRVYECNVLKNTDNEETTFYSHVSIYVRHSVSYHINSLEDKMNHSLPNCWFFFYRIEILHMYKEI